MRPILSVLSVFLLFSCMTLNGQNAPKPASTFFQGTNLELVDDVSNHNWIKAKDLVGGGASVNSRGEHGATALWYMIYSGNIDGYIWLLNEGADPNLSPDTGTQMYAWCAWADDARYLDSAVKHGLNLRPFRKGFADPLDALISSGLPIEKFRRYLDMGVNLVNIPPGGKHPVVGAIMGVRYVFALEMLRREPTIMQNEATAADVVYWLETYRFAKGIGPINIRTDRQTLVDYLKQDFGIEVNLPPDES